MTGEFVQSIPLLLLALVLLLVTWFASKYAVTLTRYLLGSRLNSDLLRNVVSRAIAIPVFLLGLYLILRVSGLTRLAMTVLGGTGIIGLVIGFAFRDIAENFLASILISMNNPFKAKDLIEVAGHKGFVQQVTSRGTLLMTLDGNHVQIPNATIYKETIINYSANPNIRCNFTVGIGYDDSIAQAQAVALRVLSDHPAVVDDPEPLVLVESLGAATVNLRVYFWVDTQKYSVVKVPSAVLRLTKLAFTQAGISMPDEAREVVFPHGVPISMLPATDATSSQGTATEIIPPTIAKPKQAVSDDDFQASNEAEGGLESEAGEIAEQARKARVPEQGTNLLDDA
jgi:small-conductance mechanosensitive channel